MKSVGLQTRKWKPSTALKVLLCVFWAIAIVLPLARMAMRPRMIGSSPSSTLEARACPTRGVMHAVAPAAMNLVED